MTPSFLQAATTKLSQDKKEASTVLECPGPSKSTYVITINAKNRSVIIDVYDANRTKVCRSSYSDGIVGSIMNANTCLMGGFGAFMSTQIVRQYVRINGEKVEFGGIPGKELVPGEGNPGTILLSQKTFVDPGKQVWHCRAGDR